MIWLFIYLIGCPIAYLLVQSIPSPRFDVGDWTDYIAPVLMALLWPIWIIFIAFFFLLFFMFGL